MKFVALIFQVLMVSAGAVAGLWYKSNVGQSPTPSHEEAGNAGHGAESKKEDASGHSEKKKPAKDNAHGGGKKSKKSGGHHGSSKAGGDSKYEYMKFGRQFIVPVVSSDAVNSLVVLDLNLEVPASSLDSVYAREPKLRDVLLSTLLQLSNQDVFDGDFLSQSNLDMLRETLLTAARSVATDEVNNVLILSISKQEL